MNSKTIIRILACVGAAVVFAAAAEKPVPKAAVEKRASKIVRLDLLQAGAPKLAPERRNIFTGTGGPAEGPGPTRSGMRIRSGANPKEAGTTEAKLDLRFIGCVVSPRGIIGLVLIEGTAQSVIQGESLRPGYVVTRLSRKDIEVTGPDGIPKTYSLQGGEE